ncbi:isoflavonoid 7-O-beta-apiosyl-glucoside beta-glycosidase-like [Gastrolobium bilobum]|uniref:isoflavonoid 7-O-beta-apiosyl-glucoside beta-glycosidase-like n=1 Tax=Gastrolobium bilobum TaxID=150636 RepID=UPI002AB0608B|nr:isoflavonoid 7-O-beta-apiosyl-glucoside beta-glycosidase-like [Gastrolobium bilobum]
MARKGFYLLGFIAFVLVISKSTVNCIETVAVEPILDFASLNRNSLISLFHFWGRILVVPSYDVIINYTKEKYKNPLIYITENGINEYDDPSLSLEESLLDTYRIDYHYRHLFYLQSAIKDGANVKGYFAWSLLDNFEWHSGYTVRFGMYFIDYKNGLKRYPKLSALWFKDFLKNRKQTLSVDSI